MNTHTHREWLSRALAEKAPLEERQRDFGQAPDQKLSSDYCQRKEGHPKTYHAPLALNTESSGQFTHVTSLNTPMGQCDGCGNALGVRLAFIARRGVVVRSVALDCGHLKHVAGSLQQIDRRSNGRGVTTSNVDKQIRT
eukprot:4174266-Amphidinium_carterae.1